jgi:hypothetical protein
LPNLEWPITISVVTLKTSGIQKHGDLVGIGLNCIKAEWQVLLAFDQGNGCTHKFVACHAAASVELTRHLAGFSQAHPLFSCCKEF